MNINSFQNTLISKKETEKTQFKIPNQSALFTVKVRHPSQAAKAAKKRRKEKTQTPIQSHHTNRNHQITQQQKSKINS